MALFRIFTRYEFLLYIFISANAYPLHETDWTDLPLLKSALQDVILNENPHDVTVLVSDHPQDAYATKIVEKVSQSVQEIRPTRMFTTEVADLFESVDVVSSSRTIFFHVCDAWKLPDEDYLYNLSSAIRSTTMRNHEVKFIMILITSGDGEGENFTTVFEKMWNMRYLHFTIVELVTPDLKSEPHSIKVHVYNPFTEITTVQSYQEGIDYFPDKLRDMNGYPFVINYNSNAPYTRMVKSSGKENTSCPYDLKGFVGFSLEAMSKVLNFTIVVNEEFMRRDSKIGGIPEDAPIDMKFAMGTVKFYLNSAKLSSAVVQNRICLIMPRIRTNPTGITPWKVVLTLLIGALVIVIFYLCSITMKFPVYLRHPVNIFGLMMGIGLTKDPDRLIEKIIFISLIAASTRYTSIFYAELVSASVLSTPELNIENIDDIRKSGLTAIFFNAYYNDTLKEIKGDVSYMKYFGQKDNNVARPFDCMDQIRLYRNVTCQVLESNAELAIAMNGEQNTKMTPFCTSPLPFNLFFPVNSPYVDYMNPILLRIVESGLPGVWSRDFFFTWRKFTNATYVPLEETSSSDYIPAHLLLSVYSLSVMAFVAEVLWNRCRSKCRKFVRRLTVQPFHID